MVKESCVCLEKSVVITGTVEASDSRDCGLKPLNLYVCQCGGGDTDRVKLDCMWPPNCSCVCESSGEGGGEEEIVRE